VSFISDLILIVHFLSFVRLNFGSAHVRCIFINIGNGSELIRDINREYFAFGSILTCILRKKIFIIIIDYQEAFKLVLCG